MDYVLSAMFLKVVQHILMTVGKEVPNPQTSNFPWVDVAEERKVGKLIHSVLARLVSAWLRRR